MSSRLNFRSPMWEVAASNGDPLLVHENILIALSEKTRLLTATALEASPVERKLNLSHWDEATVGRFAEYLYSGDYQCPDPVLLGTPISSPEKGQSVNGDINLNNPSEDQPAEDGPVEATSDKAKGAGFDPESPLAPPIRPLTPLPDIFHAGPDPIQPLSAAETFRRKHFDPAKYDFEEVLLTHACIYTLARYLEIEPLCTMALQRLLRTLINIGPVQSDWHLAAALEDLITYVYKETLNNREDQIRTVISQFVALNVVLLETDAIKRCIDKCPGFGVELMEKVYRRLAVTEQNLDKELRQSADLQLQLANEGPKLASLQSQLEEIVESASLELQLKTEKSITANLNHQLEKERAESASLKIQLEKERENARSITTAPKPVSTTGSLFGGVPFQAQYSSGLFGSVQKPNNFGATR